MTTRISGFAALARFGFVAGAALGALGALATLGGCTGAKSAKKAEWTGPIQPGVSSAAQRESVGITIYNQNFGVVREVRNVDLPIGRVSLEFRDVATGIQPETVGIRSLSDVDALSVYEQNYRYDLLTPEKLLQKYLGKHVLLHRFNEALGKDEDFDAVVLSTEGGAVFQIGNQITYGFPGRVSFPGVPKELIAKPTLVWLLGSGLGKQKVEVTYLTQGMNWRSDYVLVVDDSDTHGDLQGWVTLTNTSGASYQNAKLKLVAGDVQRIEPDRDADGVLDQEDKDSSDTPAMPEEPKFVEEGFFEYHLYSLDKPTNVLDNEQKQVSLLEAKGIVLEKKLIFTGSDDYYRASYGQVMSNQKVSVYLDVKNEEKNHLGVPLPKGIVRVYQRDKSGAQQFIGEDSIDHTPRDEKIRVKMGEAFDVVADKKQTAWTPLGDCSAESAWEISLRNHKDSAETIELDEPAGGDWQILSSTHPATKRDQTTFTFEVKVGAKSEVKVAYRVRVRWC